MKLLEFIHLTLKNRLMMMHLECGPYRTGHQQHTDNRTINNIWNARAKKWKLDQFATAKHSINRGKPYICPLEWVQKDAKFNTLPIPVYQPDGRLSLEEELNSYKAKPSAPQQYTVCPITTLYIDASLELDAYETNIRLRDRRTSSTYRTTCEYYLFEFGDGTYRDTMPRNGRADDITGVGEYHRQERPWAGKAYKDSKVYGIELETLAPNTALRVELADYARKLGMLAERDGSLAPLGLEIIAEPLEFEKVIHEKSSWKTWIEKAKAAGYTAWYALNAEGDPGGYGMHITINRRHFNPLHLEKFIAFINNEIKLSRQIAGRSSRQYAMLAPKIIGQASRALEGEKYQSVALRGASRVEVRIFRATLHWPGFLRNLEFTDAVLEFTRNCPNDAVESGTFLKWLEDHKTVYPNLVAFLPHTLQERYKLEI